MEQLSKKVGEWKQQGKKVGLLAVREFGAQITSADVFIACGENNCLVRAQSRHLFCFLTLKSQVMPENCIEL